MESTEAASGDNVRPKRPRGQFARGAPTECDVVRLRADRARQSYAQWSPVFRSHGRFRNRGIES
jgi:hypothetical protein